MWVRVRNAAYTVKVRAMLKPQAFPVLEPLSDDEANDYADPELSPLALTWTEANALAEAQRGGGRVFSKPDEEFIRFVRDMDTEADTVETTRWYSVWSLACIRTTHS